MQLSYINKRTDLLEFLLHLTFFDGKKRINKLILSLGLIIFLIVLITIGSSPTAGGYASMLIGALAIFIFFYSLIHVRIFEGIYGFPFLKLSKSKYEGALLLILGLAAFLSYFIFQSSHIAGFLVILCAGVVYYLFHFYLWEPRNISIVLKEEMFEVTFDPPVNLSSLEEASSTRTYSFDTIEKVKKSEKFLIIKLKELKASEEIYPLFLIPIESFSSEGELQDFFKIVNIKYPTD